MRTRVYVCIQFACTYVNANIESVNNLRKRYVNVDFKQPLTQKRKRNAKRRELRFLKNIDVKELKETH